jgi:rfaE bifunctional protein kinase chain/domain
MTPHRLQELLAKFPTRRIAVIGDFFLDKYLEVDPQLAEPSLETGRTAHQVVAIRASPGAAGTVVNNLAALGTGTLHTLGVVGEDGEGFELRRELDRLGCRTDSLLTNSEIHTPTYLKPRDIGVAGLAGEHSRYDTQNRRPLPESIGVELAAKLQALLGELDAVVFMDQVETEGCGVLSASLRAILNRLAAKHSRVIFWADSRKFIHEYRRMILKPNQFEAVGRANPLPGEEVPRAELQTAVSRLRAETERPVFVTCGEKGLFVSDPALELVPGVQVPGPLDPTGAGDSVTAGAVLALASGGTPAEAALIGNLVASITVQQLGTTGTATPRQVMQRMELWRQQQQPQP